MHGFIEQASSYRIGNDKLTKHEDFNMMEQRLQLKTLYYFTGEDLLSRWRSAFNFKGDFLIDEYYGGETNFGLRELNLLFTPFRFMDVKLGRQILTWGTGDYLFINDQFPKDYISFYIGRDDEYLKKPSDAVKISLYPQALNIDFVVIPFFKPNTLPQGDRLSFFDSFQGGIAGRDSDRRLVEPARQGENIEYALRLYRNLGSNELAFYYFRGFDKSPRSYLNEALRELFFQRLDVYGASLRGAVFAGIGNAEFGYYYSPQDSSGNNRLIQNSGLKTLLGYEKDMGNDFKVGFQYMYEQTLNYSAYERALLPADFSWDEYRHVLTNRITKLFKNQTVELSFFTFYSPSDKDGYIRSYLAYDITDRWSVTLGVSIPWGDGFTTDFAQMKRNKNIFARARYSF